MNWARAFVGSVIVAGGVLWLADSAELVDAGEVISNWWPVLLIAAGVVSFLSNRRQWLFPLVMIVAGVGLLLETTGAIDIGQLIFPALVILVGVLIILGRGISGGTEVSSDEIRSFNIFSGSELASNSRSFRGGNVGAVFGGADIDLRNAVLAPDAVLDAFVMFGGLEIRVPEGWRVTTRGMPIFGGVENKTAKETLPEDAPTLLISMTVLFGGLEIRH